MNLKAQLSEWEKAHPKPEPKPLVTKIYEPNKKEIVAGGDVLWRPVNREAAKLLSRAAWLSQPPQEPIYATDKRTKAEAKGSLQKGVHSVSRPDNEPQADARTSAKGAPPKAVRRNAGEVRAKVVPCKKTPTAPRLGNSSVMSEPIEGVVRGERNGLTFKYVDGEPMISLEEANAFFVAEIAKLPKETRPAVKAAEDARAIIQELTQGLGGDMERFKADSKRYLEDIRSTRFAMVTEASQMTGPLREVRQFFLGGDYKEELTRLREFVDLCERLHKLKEAGFLDSIADTMLRLDK